MSGDEIPRTGAMRFTGTGDVEVFDGRSWHPLSSIMGDSGMREDPEQRGEADSAAPSRQSEHAEGSAQPEQDSY